MTYSGRGYPLGLEVVDLPGFLEVTEVDHAGGDSTLLSTRCVSRRDGWNRPMARLRCFCTSINTMIGLGITAAVPANQAHLRRAGPTQGRRLCSGPRNAHCAATQTSAPPAHRTCSAARARYSGLAASRRGVALSGSFPRIFVLYFRRVRGLQHQSC
jgi:hypothetical protein